MSQNFVDVRHLTKIYPGQRMAAVDNVSFTLKRGEMLALLGPSGCGKTTILRMIAGLIEPSSGSIIVDGREIANVPVHRRGIGMVFQAYAFAVSAFVGGAKRLLWDWKCKTCRAPSGSGACARRLNW